MYLIFIYISELPSFNTCFTAYKSYMSKSCQSQTPDSKTTTLDKQEDLYKNK